jgi:hypothetical protein
MSTDVPPARRIRSYAGGLSVPGARRLTPLELPDAIRSAHRALAVVLLASVNGYDQS